MENCIFCKIISGELNSFKVYENDFSLVILDANPINPGHVLVLPKKHFGKLSEIDELYGTELFKTVMKMEKLISLCGCSGTNILQNNGKLAGQEIDHMHFHIIPRFANDTFRFKHRKVPITEEMQKYVLKQYRDKLDKGDATDIAE